MRRASLSLNGLVIAAALLCAAPIAPSPTAQSPTAPPQFALAGGPALSVDAGAGLHPISAGIYGMSFADEDLAAEIDLPVRRWGGNTTTRYNWQLDIANHASDWYFQNIPEDNPNPGLLPNGSAADLFVEQDRRTGSATLLTVPIIGWTTKGPRARACGFSLSLYGPQEFVAPENADCGNGRHSDGTPITGNDPHDTSDPITPAFDAAWVAHLVSRYGDASHGGVCCYALDNEPALWWETHRDIHPLPVSYDEILSRTVAYASAIKTADPGAKTYGPVAWGWVEYFYSALDVAAGGEWWNTRPDRMAHGDTPFVEWYLAQLQAYEHAHGQRLLDFLDLHFYPQGAEIFSPDVGSASVQALRLRSTRALWDPTYVDESWIDEPVNLIPRMHAWVDQFYPGTRLALTEYSWGAQGHLNGALAQADVLGIFGRESLDLATLWDPPTADQPGAYAFRMYRNYDGAHHRFGDTSVQASSADQSVLSIYAARRAIDGALTLMVINKSPSTAVTSTVALAGFAPGATASVFRYSGANLNAIVSEPDQPLTPAGFTAAFPAASITLFVIPSAFPLTPRAYLPTLSH